jgi:DNA-directed RNA polymerase specialized sigma24 family protein
MQVVAAPAVRELFRLEVTCGKQAGILRRQDSDPDEHVHEGILQTVQYATRKEGLAMPLGFEARQDVRPFLRKIFRDRLIDRYRRTARNETLTVRWDNARWGSLAVEAEESPGPAQDPVRVATYEALLDSGALRLTHAIAYGAERDLHLIERVVERLRNGPIADPGLLRSAVETADRLEYWLCNVGNAPAPARARRALAWILRSTDQTDSNQWQARDKASVDSALDLLRKWQFRAENVLRLQVLVRPHATLAA